jgi:hypothetical protein
LTLFARANRVPGSIVGLRGEVFGVINQELERFRPISDFFGRSRHSFKNFELL